MNECIIADLTAEIKPDLKKNPLGWDEFSPWISGWDYAPEQPSHRPTNELLKQIFTTPKGTPGRCTLNGITHRYLQPWLWDRCLANGHNLYISGGPKQGLMGLDFDRHQTWQTEEDTLRCRDLVNKVLLRHLGRDVVLHMASNRGHNGLTKVTYASPGRYNLVMDSLQQGFRRLLAHHGLLPDFEIKGKASFMATGELRRGTYTKIALGRLTPKLVSEFAGLPSVPLGKLEQLARLLNEAFGPEELAALEERRRQLGECPLTNGPEWLVGPTMIARLERAYGPAWPSLHEVIHRGDDEW
jgi:hypothetical protein